MERKAPDHRTQAGWAFGLLVARMPLVAEGAARLIEPGHYQISHPLGPRGRGHGKQFRGKKKLVPDAC